MYKLEKKISTFFENQDLLEDAESHSYIKEAISLLDQGKIRVCYKQDNKWEVNQWIKKAILLYFRISKSKTIHIDPFEFFDKIPVKKNYEFSGVRVVPNAIARYGSFIEKGAILMPSYINIGAYVGANTMIDTWATVGSCAQVGNNVHISGGVGIGGVLEPLQATPVIIEDGCFVGSRCVIVEGVVIKSRAVLGSNVVLTQSTKIIDVTGKNPVYYNSKIPEDSVVIPGTYTREYPAGSYQVPCALIIGKRKSSTDLKTSLNDVLRDYKI